MSKNESTRSVSYPSLPLEEALVRLVNFKSGLGVNGQFNRETVAKAIGYLSVSGASSRAVAALVQFGLLDREKDTYSLSSLGRQFLMPTEEGADKKAIRDAALQPKLFNQIFSNYHGQVLPKQLANILVVNHRVQANAAPQVVKLIEATFRYAELMNEDGVLKDINDSDQFQNVESERLSDQDENDNKNQDEAIKPPLVVVDGRQSVNHKGQGWEVTVVFERTRDLDAGTRKEVRNLMNAAEDLADKLYDMDSSLVDGEVGEM